VKPSTALEHHREDIRRLVANHRAANARVFGSVLKGADQDNSDLDLLVDPLPGATLLDLGSLQMELEETLGVPVDLRTPGDLPAGYRTSILDDARPV